MSLLQNSNAISTGSAYNLESSLRFRSSASAYLSRTFTTPTNSKKMTLSFWYKHTQFGVSSHILSNDGAVGTSDEEIYFNTSDVLAYFSRNPNVNAYTNRVFRDPSAWYHCVVAVDTTQANSADRVKIYVNGNEETITTSYDLNRDLRLNSAGVKYIGRRSDGVYLDGYLTEYNFIDGQQLTADDFGETDTTTGVWKPKEYKGTYGTNGFYLPMKETQQATGFNTVLYTGNGGTQSISNVGFSPDLVWVKDRTVANNHVIEDTIRGAGYDLKPNTTDAENYNVNRISSFDSNGFTFGGKNTSFNANGNNYVAWCWDAGSSTVSNTDGTITSSVRANPATGFSIVTYTGTGANATVGHGLGSAPDMIIVKNRDNTKAWLVYHSANTAEPETDYLVLNDTVATADNIIAWNDTAPTSSVFSLGTSQSANESGNGHVAYCFSEVAGFSKFGSYTGNGTSNSITGLGFKPAWIMLKDASSGTRSWSIVDNTRSVNDDREDVLYPNLSAVEGVVTNYDISFDADGFTVGSNSQINASGSNIIYMAFADTRDAQFNFDGSGNKNNWTANNINSNASSETTYDIMNDVATLTDEDTANFATLNPLLPSTSTTLSNGNLNASVYSNAYSSISGTIGINSGKWYWETNVQTNAIHGVADVPIGNNYPGAYGNSCGWNVAYGVSSPYFYVSGSITKNATISGGTVSVGDTVGVALDMDAGKLYYYINGVAINNGNFVFENITGTVFPVSRSGSGTGIWYNFGQRPFAYTPPTGYKKLNTYNLPDSTIKDGSQYMNPVLYTGNSSTNAITGVGFSPDFTWIKRRSGANAHQLYDTVRGAGYVLKSDSTNAEAVETAFNSFDADGFEVDGGSGSHNLSGESYVAWNWRASDSSAVSNTDGTITSTVSANTDSGFSIVKWTHNGTAFDTVGHGLGAKPQIVIQKLTSQAGNWAVFTDIIDGSMDYLYLNTTAAAANTSNITPTSSYFGQIGGTSGWEVVAYCFAEVEGFSKFGSYTGNGSTDGPFVYTGFRPAFVIMKKTSSTSSWQINDTARDTYNETNKRLFAEASNAESGTYDKLDILSNGFKHRTSNDMNLSGQTYIYMAFAENPFKQSLAR